MDINCHAQSNDLHFLLAFVSVIQKTQREALGYRIKPFTGNASRGQERGHRGWRLANCEKIRRYCQPHHQNENERMPSHCRAICNAHYLLWNYFHPIPRFICQGVQAIRWTTLIVSLEVRTQKSWCARPSDFRWRVFHQWLLSNLSLWARCAFRDLGETLDSSCQASYVFQCRLWRTMVCFLVNAPHVNFSMNFYWKGTVEWNIGAIYFSCLSLVSVISSCSLCICRSPPRRESWGKLNVGIFLATAVFDLTN